MVQVIETRMMSHHLRRIQHQRVTKVAVREVAEIVDVLDPQRLVESELGLIRVDHLLHASGVDAAGGDHHADALDNWITPGR